MNWTWEVTTGPASEPVSLADMKEHLRVDITDDDDLITAQIVAARRWIEQYCNRSLFTQTLTAYFDRMPLDRIMLPQSPVASVASFNYVDTSGDSQTITASDYLVDTVSTPCRIEPAYSKSWPSARTQLNAVNVVYVAGSASISEDIIHALKLMVGTMYLARENDCPMQTYQPSVTIKSLLSAYKLYYRGPW